VTAEEIQRRIEASIPGARASVEGGDAHFSVVVIAEGFEGKTRIERHQMIYSLFRDEMASQAIHALALKTSTPQEWERARQPMEIGS
jgi:acid stress-induced BolA-like protein IbaG/YrbA